MFSSGTALRSLTKAKTLNKGLGAFRRQQSSFTFLDNRSLLQKTSVKQSESDKHSSEAVELENADLKVSGAKSGQAKIHGSGSSVNKPEVPKRLDYSWLPRVPPTTHLNHKDVRTNVLYSGYRPIYISETANGTGAGLGSKNGSNNSLYEFAMKLDNMSEPTPWISSATGLEFYSEWDNVPTEVLKNIKPFDLDYQQQHQKNEDSKDSTEDLKIQALTKQHNERVNSKSGRKKPIVRLLQMMKSFKKKND